MIRLVGIDNIEDSISSRRNKLVGMGPDFNKRFDKESVRQNLIDAFKIPKGQRLMDPEYGLPEYIAPTGLYPLAITEQHMRTRAERLLRQHGDRVTLSDVTVRLDSTGSKYIVDYTFKFQSDFVTTTSEDSTEKITITY
jgi:phage baseplate assembly protein W